MQKPKLPMSTISLRVYENNAINLFLYHSERMKFWSAWILHKEKAIIMSSRYGTYNSALLYFHFPFLNDTIPAFGVSPIFGGS